MTVAVVKPNHLIEMYAFIMCILVGLHMYLCMHACIAELCVCVVGGWVWEGV